MRIAVALLGATLVVSAAAQSTPAENVPKAKQPASAKTSASSAQSKASVAQPQQDEAALRLLESAEAQANGLPPAMRAYTLTEIARAYQATDRKKAIALLGEALTSTWGMEPDDRTNMRSRTQSTIAKQLAVLAPAKLDDVVLQLDTPARKDALEALISYYEGKKQYRRAVEVVNRVTGESEFPYGAGARVMLALPESDAGDVNALFSSALTSFRDHAADRAKRRSFGDADMSALVLRTWKRVPSGMVKEAIAELLKDGEESDKKQQSNAISIASEKGAATFNSNYQYRLFQLVPVLKQIDPDEADRLLKKNAELQEMLNKYPDGGGSFLPDLSGQRPAKQQPQGNAPADTKAAAKTGTPAQRNATMQVSIGGPIMNRANMQAEVAEMQRAAKIATTAETDPEQALTDAASLKMKNNRAQALVSIARISAKKKPSTAKSALKQALEVAPEMEMLPLAMSVVRDAANVYLLMDEKEDAKKAVETGLKIADALYKSDTDSDNPNNALKSYWPSTDAYRSMLQIAAKISPQWAMTLLKDLPDDELKVVGQTALALGWLNVGGGNSTTIVARKDGTVRQMSFGNPE